MLPLAFAQQAPPHIAQFQLGRMLHIDTGPHRLDEVQLPRWAVHCHLTQQIEPDKRECEYLKDFETPMDPSELAAIQEELRVTYCSFDPFRSIRLCADCELE